jgi:uncharacterized protein
LRVSPEVAKPFISTNESGVLLNREVFMAGTKNGGKSAAATNKAKYGADFYARIGAMGGKKGHTGGFAANRELARVAGAKGGRISRRTKKVA